MTPINANVVAALIRTMTRELDEIPAVHAKHRSDCQAVLRNLARRIARDCLEHGAETDEFFRACGVHAVDGRR